MKNSNGTDILESVFDAMPSIIFVVDEDVRIQEYNAAAAKSAYFKEHWGVDFSHGICPECYKSEIEKLKIDSKDCQRFSSGK